MRVLEANCKLKDCGVPITRKRRGRPKIYCADCAKKVQLGQIREYKRRVREIRKYNQWARKRKQAQARESRGRTR